MLPGAIRRPIAIGIFALFLLLSQVILPVLGRADVYPFFTWNILSSLAKPDERYDLALTFKDGSQCFFSVCADRNLRVDRRVLWYLIQKMGLLSIHNENVGDTREEIVAVLAPERDRLGEVRLVQIRGYFSDFIFSGAAKTVSPERYYDLGVVSDGK